MVSVLFMDRDAPVLAWARSLLTCRLTEGDMTDSRQRLSTGILGLDEVLGGGLIRGGIYLVMGKPGAGKTICGNQICFAHAARKERAAYVTLLAETHSRMTMNLERMRFFSSQPIGESLLYLGGYMPLREKGLPGLLDLLRRVMRAEKPSLLVIDGLMTSRSYASSDIALKEFIIELQVLGTMNECTTLLLSNMTAEDLNGPEHTMVDGLIELRMEAARERTLRVLEVIKMRGSRHYLGKQEMSITDEGLVVYPNTEERLTRVARTAPPCTGRLSTGVRNLDGILGGGLRAGSTTMALGFSGSGKTMLGQHFLSSGDEKSLYFGFYESPERFLESSDALGLSLRQRFDSGQLGILWQPARRHGLDSLSQLLLENVIRRDVKRVVIDGFDGLRQASFANPERVTSYLTSILNELRARDVTVLFTEETSKAMGPEIEVRVEGVSALVENIVLLDYVDVGTQLKRLLSVIKQRGSAYESAIRELVIGPQGMQLADDSTSAEEILGSATARSMPLYLRTRRGPPAGNGH
jgi:circadian clock protein KaiC